MKRAGDTSANLYEDVLCHVDVGPVLHDYMDVESLLALCCTHRAASDAIAFSGKDAKAERLRLTKEYVIDGGGHLGVLQTVMSTMAQEGRLHMLQYMCIAPSPFQITPVTISAAAGRGQMHILEWAQRTVPPIERGWRLGGGPGCECRAALNAARLDVLEWLLAHGYNMPPGGWADDVAGRGHTHVLEWTLKRGLLMPAAPAPGYVRGPTHWTCTRAAQMGHIDTLKWLRALEPPCPWDIKHILRTIDRVLRLWVEKNPIQIPTDRRCVRPSQLIKVLEWMRDDDACKSIRHKICGVLSDVASSDLVESDAY